MPVEFEGFDQVEEKLKNLFAGMEKDHALVGEAGAEAIVRSTLAGIRDGDKPFTPYSKAYKEILDAVGGKMRQVVDLRGIFYHDGQKRKRYRSESRRQLEREGRQAYVGIQFVARTDYAAAAGGKAQIGFTGRTGITRPQVGVNDLRSEMSLDLIHIEATDDSLTIIYRPRKDPYMIRHHRGEDGMPERPWFSANKRVVAEAMRKVLARCIRARLAWFNDHAQAGTPPKPQPDTPAPE